MLTHGLMGEGSNPPASGHTHTIAGSSERGFKSHSSQVFGPQVMVHAHRPPPSTRFLSSAVERDTSNVEVSRSNRLGSSSFCVCCCFVLCPVTFACLLPVAQRLNFGALGMGRGQVPVPLPSTIYHQRSRGLVVLTLDFESNNRRFDPGRDLKLSFFFGWVGFGCVS